METLGSKLSAGRKLYNDWVTQWGTGERSSIVENLVTTTLIDFKPLSQEKQ